MATKTTNLERLRVLMAAATEAEQGHPRPQVSILDYVIEKVSSEPNQVNYHLHGHKATYRLVRRDNGRSLYAINTVGNICGIKGNYTFSDEGGTLVTVNA